MAMSSSNSRTRFALTMHEAVHRVNRRVMGPMRIKSTEVTLSHLHLLDFFFHRVRYTHRCSDAAETGVNRVLTRIFVVRTTLLHFLLLSVLFLFSSKESPNITWVWLDNLQNVFCYCLCTMLHSYLSWTVYYYYCYCWYCHYHYT